MVSIKWCLKQKKGLELVEPNKNMSDSYIKMAEESIVALKNVEESKIWTATTAYYVFYYSLYSLMLRIGIKCEIHSCSLEFMKQLLNTFYNQMDFKMINSSFSARINLQYYANRAVEPEIIEKVKKYCKDFFVKTKDILSNITEKDIAVIKDKLAMF